MKAYLGIRDTDAVYHAEQDDPGTTLFGIDTREKNFTRVRVA